MLLGFILLTANTAFAAHADASLIDASSASLGFVSVKYSETNNTKVKVMVEKDGLKYTYNLDNTKETECFPLQMGQGSYHVTVFENVGGSSYKAVMSKSLSASIADANQPFLQSVQSIEWDESMKAVMKAKELTKDLKTDAEKAKAIYNYIVMNMKYDYTKKDKLTAGYVPNIDEVFLAGSGICYDFSSVLAGMLRSVGIPAKLVKGYSTTTPVYHAWNEVYLDGQWMIVDASYDSQMNDYKKTYAMEKDAAWYDKKYEF